MKFFFRVVNPIKLILTLVFFGLITQNSLAEVSGNYSAIIVPDDDSKLATVYWSTRISTDIKAPAKDVWPTLSGLSLEIQSKWNPTVVKVERISGEPGKVGEVVRNTKNTGQAPFYMRVVRLQPPTERVLYLWDDKQSLLNSFINHSLSESNGITTFTHLGNYVSRMPMAAAEEFAKSINSGSLDGYFKHGMELLKADVEKQR